MTTKQANKRMASFSFHVEALLRLINNDLERVHAMARERELLTMEMDYRNAILEAVAPKKP